MFSQHPLTIVGAILLSLASFGLIAHRAAGERDGEQTGTAGPSNLRVVYPPEGALVTAERVGFFGDATPGSVVRAGGLSVRADAKGKWEIVLPVIRGNNRIAFKATDKAGETAKVILNIRR